MFENAYFSGNLHFETPWVSMYLGLGGQQTLLNANGV